MPDFRTYWSILNVRFGKIVPSVVASATVIFSAPAVAAGTSAGSTISNTASATYTAAGGQSVTIPSNKVDLKVDEILNVTVASADPGDVSAPSGGTNQVLSFRVTNTGNGSEPFRLDVINALGGDAFDPSTTSIVLDTNGDGVYSAATDTVYVAGSNNPVLAADASIRVFVLSTVPGTATDGQRGQTDFTATAVTGSGTAGTTFAGAGDGGGDAVVGTSTGVGRDKGFYLVTAATVSFLKSAVVADPFGGTRTVPGSVITYTLVTSVSGNGTLSNLAIGDPVPTTTTYVPGSLILDGAALSDGADTDAGEFSGTAIAARLGNVSAGQTRTVIFKTKIN